MLEAASFSQYSCCEHSDQVVLSIDWSVALDIVDNVYRHALGTAELAKVLVLGYNSYGALTPYKMTQLPWTTLISVVCHSLRYIYRMQFRNTLKML